MRAAVTGRPGAHAQPATFLRGWKLYSFHAPEVECIGKGKAATLYEFSVKASVITTNGRPPGSEFVLHAKALPGNPYDGHTLGDVIDATEKLTGCTIELAYVEKDSRKLRQRSAIEPIIDVFRRANLPP